MIIGGGHAGCEPAAAAGRTGAATALIIHRADWLGENLATSRIFVGLAP